MADPLADLDNLLNELDRSVSNPKPASPSVSRVNTSSSNTINKIPAPQAQAAPAPASNDSWKNELEDLLSELSVAAPTPASSAPSSSVTRTSVTNTQTTSTSSPAATPSQPAATFQPQQQHHQQQQTQTAQVHAPTARTIVSAPAPTYTATEATQINYTSGGPALILTPEEEGLVRELNKVRTNPHAYASVLEAERKPYFDGKNLKLPGSNVILVTEEGVAAVDEAIRFLRSTQPLPPFSVSTAMAKSAREALAEVGPTGETSCESIKRFEQYGRFEQEAVEIASFGTSDPREIVVRFLVCDGQPDRVQRTYVFEPIYQCIGLAIGEHKSAYKTMACINFTKMFHAK